MNLKLLTSIVLTAFMLGFMAGCATAPDPMLDPDGNVVKDADGNPVLPREIMDRLEFDNNEYGCADIRGEVALTPIPWFGSKVNVVIKKVRPAPDGGETPEC